MIPPEESCPPAGERPLVTVFCITYNHADYVSQSIAGILSQVTNFRVELVVHDDASADRTTNLILDAESQHPGRIRHILQTENQMRKGVDVIVDLFSTAAGEFIALCEGDDYWTDPTKLQRQVDLLVAHPESSACFHSADGLFEDTGELIPGHFGPEANKTTYGIDDLLPKGNFVPTCSIVFRKSVFSPVPEWKSRAPHGDITLLCIAASKGPLLYIDRSMAVYRKHSGGMHTSLAPVLQILNAIETHHIICENLGITHRGSYREGLEFRRSQFRDLVKNNEASLASLQNEIAFLEETLSGVRTSKTFKLGRLLSRWRDNLNLGLGRS